MEKISIKSFLDYKFLSNLEFNESGNIAAFTVTQANIANNNYDYTIYLLDENDKCRQLTSGNKEKNLFWFDDNTVAFISNRDEKIKKLQEAGEEWTAIYGININGGEAYKLFDVEMNVSSVKKIANDDYILLCEYDNYKKKLNGLKGEAREELLAEYEDNKDYEIFDEIPFWGNGIGYTNKKRTRLYLYNVKTKEAKPLTDEFTEVEMFKYKDGKILFIAERFTDKLQQTNALYEYDIKAEKMTELVKDGLYNFGYANYLNDKIFCVASDMKSYGINENQEFYLVENGDIKEYKLIDACIGSSVGSDCKYGGGKSIEIRGDEVYFITTIDDYSCIKVLRANGDLETLTKETSSVSAFDVRNGKIKYIALKNNHLQEVYSLDGYKENKLTSFNDEVMTKYSFTIPEKIVFETNGDKTEGFVIKPLDYDASKKYPAILDIHGGPKTVYGDIIYHEMQVWANMGYFVFFCNPHGSEGKGNKFADIRGKYGTIDYEDIMNFTDLVLERYNIDETRVGVTGGSYGGFMTNWIIGHTDRFKCAASQRSISNWISKFGTTDIGYYFNADQNQATPWINHDKLWWHSPLKYADKVKTPTLFIHSVEDYRCWLPEGIQMYTALKYHGVDARLCMFKGETHDLSRSGKPRHRIKRLTEMTNWFEKYLK